MRSYIYISAPTIQGSLQWRRVVGGDYPSRPGAHIKTEHKDKLRVVAVHLEESLKAFDAILETDDIAPLYPASREVLAALTELHGADATLLSPEGRARVEEQINKEKKKRSGRDSFNTGF